MTLAEHVQAYQTYLEGHRQDPDNDELYQDLVTARNALQLAWLEQAWDTTTDA